MDGISKLVSLIRIRAFALACCLVSVVLSGCGRPPGVIFPRIEPAIVWPKPPEEPHLRYVGQISMETDLKKGLSWSEGIGELFFGKKDIGVLVGPYAVVIDKDERMFVADSTSGVIHMFDLGKRKYRQFSALYEDESLQMPVSLTLVGNELYVVDSLRHEVCVFNKSGDFKYCFGSDELKRPSGLAYSTATDRLYISDTANHVIKVFARTGVLVSKLGNRGSGVREFNFPTHLWIDDSERLYVSDTLNYRVQVFSTDGRFIMEFGRHGDRPGNFAHPSGLATDSRGNIYVADRQYENLQIFDSKGSILMALGNEGSAPGEFWLPGGIYIDENDRIYVADSFNNRIQVFEFLSRQNDEE